MQITIEELAALVGGQFAFPADAGRLVRGIAAIAEAEEGDLTFFGNAKYLPALKQCRATAALVPADFQEAIGPVTIRVTNPSLAFAQVLERFKPDPVKFAPGIHPSAVIGREVVIGEGASVQPFAVIEDRARIGVGSVIGAHAYVGHDARIGDGCLLHPRVTVGERCILGARVILHSGVVLGSDGFGFEFVAGKHVKVPQIGIVQIDDDVEIGANTTIDRARFGRTWIGAGTKIDNLVQIAHNVVTGQHCLIISQVGISGSTRLGKYVTIAGQAGLVGHIEIGDQAIIAAQSGVSKSLSAGETYIGAPAIPARQFKEQIGQIHRLPRLSARVRKLEQLSDAAGKTSPGEG